MNQREAVDLLRPAIPATGGTWADLGAGTGTFTRALASLLGPDGRVYAVERNTAALSALRSTAPPAAGATIIPVQADFTEPLLLRGAEPGRLDGLLFANSLHFLADAARVLRQLTAWLRPGGSVVLVEYDRRAASRWVPHPIGVQRWTELATEAHLENVRVVARVPSSYSGDLYVGAAVTPT